jgi:tetratricopeptide (TPR) repeat protein
MKNTKMKVASALAAMLMIGANAGAQTLKTPAPSPSQTVKQAFGLAELSIEYSRPSVKGRVIYGDLVPYGKIWRTGANAATKITFAEDIKVEGNPIAAGTYALYTIPDKEMWEIIFYKDLTLGGNVADYKATDEVLRVKVKSSKLNDKVETFTINVADINPTSAKIELNWDNTRVAFGISTDIDAKIMKNIETVMAPADKRPYYQAANYYYENDKDLKQALDWSKKAMENDPKAYWVALLNGKILLKMKDAKGAMAAAEKVIALAKEDKDDDFVKRGEKLLADAKSMK